MPNGKFEPLGGRSRIKRYIPTIGVPKWDINNLTREDRSEIKKNIKVGITTSEEEYKAVIAYMYTKFPDLFDLTTKDNLSIQWKYSTHRNKSSVKASDEMLDVIKANKASRARLGDENLDYADDSFDMYALIYYDESRDNEPVLFGGSYLKEHRITEPVEEKYIYDKEANTQIIGHGYVLHTDYQYRRMGLAVDSWITESQIYRDNNIEKQYEIQNADSLRVTQSMFADKSKCQIVAPGRLKSDGTRAGIRVVLDYSDQELIDRFNNMEENMKNIYQPMDWSFLEREGLTIEELNKFWND